MIARELSAHNLQICLHMQNLGYTGDCSFNTFLYPNEKDSRWVADFSWRLLYVVASRSISQRLHATNTDIDATSGVQYVCSAILQFLIEALPKAEEEEQEEVGCSKEFSACRCYLPVLFSCVTGL